MSSCVQVVYHYFLIFFLFNKLPKLISNFLRNFALVFSFKNHFQICKDHFQSVVLFYRFFSQQPGPPDSSGYIHRLSPDFHAWRNSQDKLFPQHHELQPNPLVWADASRGAAAPGKCDGDLREARGGTQRGDGWGSL